MFRRIVFVIILSLLITSCGGAAPGVPLQPVAVETPTATEPPVQPLVANSVEALPSSTPEPTLIPADTSTPTPVPPTPTETELPALVLPTEAVNAPAQMVWDGTPTYLGDSKPGYSFRVTYDPDLWALTTDQFGQPAIGHRKIESCIMTPAFGRGLPANITTEHDILYAGNISFDVNTAFENGVKKFVTYVGGDGNIITGFEVDFKDQADQCLADAVTVLSTLQSVPASQATPVSVIIQTVQMVSPLSAINVQPASGENIPSGSVTSQSCSSHEGGLPCAIP